MLLPGQLRETTLGDLLGTLLRAHASGALELHEAGRVHVLHLRDGALVTIESELGPKLGELLDIRERLRFEAQHLALPKTGLPGSETEAAGLTPEQQSGHAWLRRGLISRSELAQALTRQRDLRFQALLKLQDAELRFRIPRPKSGDPTDPRPLEVADALRGAARKRDQSGAGARRSEAATAPKGARELALQVLGLPPTATATEIRQTFRRLALECHPDRHQTVSEVRKQILFHRFARISRAYHELCS